MLLRDFWVLDTEYREISRILDYVLRHVAMGFPKEIILPLVNLPVDN